MKCLCDDENEPEVFGADEGFSIKYDDHIEFNVSDLEGEKKLKQFQQIEIDMIYIFSKVK